MPLAFGLHEIKGGTGRDTSAWLQTGRSPAGWVGRGAPPPTCPPTNPPLPTCTPSRPQVTLFRVHKHFITPEALYYRFK